MWQFGSFDLDASEVMLRPRKSTRDEVTNRSDD